MYNLGDQTRNIARARIEAIASDNAAGAAEILGRAAELFSLLEHWPGESTDRESARAVVVDMCAALVRAQPAMTPLRNLASSVLAEAMSADTAGEVTRRAAHRARDFVTRAARAAGQAATCAAELIHDGATVLTHSRSSTVVAALVEAIRNKKTIKVIATEGRPILEGRALAARISGEGASVSLIADAAAAFMMKDADLILVGADTVTPEMIVNKIGTRMIVLAARERGLPVYALCDTSKLTARAQGFIEPRRGAEELWADRPASISVINYYFEPTPLDYFTSIITEEGALTPEEAARRAEQVTSHESLPDEIE